MKNSSFGSTLRVLREREKLSIKEVIEKLKEYNLNITDKTLYSYESDKRAASADMLLALCQIYQCNNILETFAGIKPDYSIPTDSEMELIKKYRSLDPHGRQTVDIILDREVKRFDQLRQSQSENESLKLQLSRGQFLNRLVGDGELLSINPDYAPIPGEDVKVLGRVLGKIDGDYRIIK